MRKSAEYVKCDLVMRFPKEEDMYLVLVDKQAFNVQVFGWFSQLYPPYPTNQGYRLVLARQAVKKIA